MHRAQAVGIVELERLDLTAVGEHRMRRRKPLPCAPDAARLGTVYSDKLLHQYPAVLGQRAVDAATQRVQHQEFDAGDYLRRNVLPAQSRNEFSQRPGIEIVVAFICVHMLLLARCQSSPLSSPGSPPSSLTIDLRLRSAACLRFSAESKNAS